MNRLLLFILPVLITYACNNNGLIAKRQLRSKKPPSVQIAEGYDKKETKVKTYKNPKQAEKARLKEQEKIKKRGRKHIKQTNRNN